MYYIHVTDEKYDLTILCRTRILYNFFPELVVTAVSQAQPPRGRIYSAYGSTRSVLLSNISPLGQKKIAETHDYNKLVGNPARSCGILK
jgi:hypothetical protein